MFFSSRLHSQHFSYPSIALLPSLSPSFHSCFTLSKFLFFAFISLMPFLFCFTVCCCFPNLPYTCSILPFKWIGSTPCYHWIGILLATVQGPRILRPFGMHLSLIFELGLGCNILILWRSNFYSGITAYLLEPCAFCPMFAFHLGQSIVPFYCMLFFLKTIKIYAWSCTPG